MHILKRLENNNRKNNLVISNKLSLNLRGIKKYQNKISNFLKYCAGKKVALIISDDFILAEWLILLDGLSSRISIIPSNLSPLATRDLVDSSSSEMILTNYDIKIEYKNIYKISDAESNIYADLRYDYKTEWAISTSGTTRKPRLVIHDLQRLMSATKEIKNKDNFVWGLLYGMQRFAGIQVFLQSIFNSSLFIPNLSNNLNFIVNQFLDNSINCLSASPTLWRKLLMSPKFTELQMRVITLGGEIADQNILNALKKNFKDAKIRHIYASTEAGVGFSVTDGLAGFPKKYLEKNHNNFNLKISNKNTLLIRSDAIATKYADSNLNFKDEDGFIDTDDLIKTKGDRCVFLGRKNGTINIGGNKIHPEMIENVLISFEGVKLAKVYSKKSSIIGGILICDLVIDNKITDTDKFTQKIKIFCSKKIDNFMIPNIIKYVKNIELTSTGKISRL